VLAAQNEITPREFRSVIIWASCLLLLCLIGGYAGVKQLRGYAADTQQERQAKIAALHVDNDNSLSRTYTQEKTKPVEVQVALSMNRLGEFALRQNAWTADFNLAFRWQGDAVKSMAGFRIVNGQTLRQELRESNHAGKQHYEMYHVVARMTSAFDAARFPFSDEGLLIQIEDAKRAAGSLRFVADLANTEVGAEAMPRAVKLSKFMAGVNSNPSSFAQISPGRNGANDHSYSRYYFAMLVTTANIQIYLKMFQALFASVAITFIAFFVKPLHVNPRFGLPVGAFFAAVSNNVYVSTLLPPSDQLTLVDMVNAVGLLSIFFVTVQSAVSLYILDTLGRPQLSRFFDRVYFVVILLGYLSLNLALPLAARP
jgi:hypothetical protein